MVKVFDVEMTTTSKDLGANAILRTISQVHNSYVTVGYHAPETLKLSTYRGKTKSNVPLGTYAYWNEFGNIQNNQVPRPTLSPMFHVRREQFVKQTATHMRKLYRTPRTTSAMFILKTQGKRAEGWLRRQIMTFSGAPNKPSTVVWKRRQKMRQRVLQLTGTMVKSVSSKVVLNKRPDMRLIRLLEKAERDLKKVKI